MKQKTNVSQRKPTKPNSRFHTKSNDIVDPSTAEQTEEGVNHPI